MPSNVSGVQFIHHSVTGEELHFKDHGRCAICGGKLTEKSFKTKEALSGSWTDTHVLEAKDSDEICASCRWMISNRMQYWQKSRMIVFKEQGFDILDEATLTDYLMSDFKTPCIFMVKGKDKSVTQKHTAWKANHGITEDRNKVRLNFYDIQIFNTKLDGVFEFDADHFVATVTRLQDIIMSTIDPLMADKKKWSNSFKANFAAQKLYDTFIADEDSRKMTMEVLLGCFFAAQRTYPPEEKNKEK
jgi:CRISPR type IV-associated protein Csf1